MNRRDFLFLRVEPTGQEIRLSCEWLYMRYLDSDLDESTDALFARLTDEFRAAKEIRITETSWLSCEPFRARFDQAIAESGVRAVAR